MTLEKQSIRILVVDDEQGLRDLLQMTFEMEAYEVVTACNGMEALEAMDKQKFQLVVTDVMMPKMDGLKLLEEVKKRDARVEVIVTTGYGKVEATETAMSNGAFECVVKPYSIDKILEVAKKALERKPC